MFHMGKLYLPLFLHSIMEKNNIQPNRTERVTEAFFPLENIQCIDSTGEVFEKYNKLWISKDFARDGAGKLIKLPAQRATSYCEERGMFLPSFALTANILARLDSSRDRFSLEILEQYKANDELIQNTDIDGIWHTCDIIHYPRDKDVGYSLGHIAREKGFSEKMNKQRRRIKRSFDANGFYYMELEQAMQEFPKSFGEYFRNLTGLENPLVLGKIRKSLGLDTKVWMRMYNTAGEAERAAFYGEDRPIGFERKMCYFGKTEGVFRPVMV